MTLTRSRWLTLALNLGLARWLVGQDANQVRVAGKLEPHSVIERELGSGQTDEYTMDVIAGQLVRLLAEQMGAHVVIKVLDPEGKTVVEADRPNGAYGRVAASLIGDVTGRYRARITSGSESAGHYRIEVVESSEPTGSDRSRIEEESTELQAGRERRVGTREARLRSIELYERASSTWRRLEDANAEGFSSDMIGALYSSLGEQRKALEYFNQALPLTRAAGDRPGETRTLIHIAYVYDDLGEKQKALDYYGQALPPVRAIGDWPSEATTLNNIGFDYAALGEREKALQYHSQALPLFRAVGDRSGEAATLNYTGRVYDALGEKEKALDYYNQALLLRRAIGDRSGEAGIANGIGAVCDSFGDKKMTMESCRHASGGGSIGGVLGGIIGAVPSTAPPPPPPPGTAIPQRIRIGGNVQAAKLITQVRPVYPPLAKAARIQGTVEFSVIIAKDGKVQDLKVLSGHPLLVQAALDAVKNWVYRPTTLLGQPVEVSTTIDVNFQLQP